MNAIARKVLRILEESPMGDLSVHFLRKQCAEASLEFDSLDHDDLAVLAKRLERILPFFIGKSTASVLEAITLLQEEHAI